MDAANERARGTPVQPPTEDHPAGVAERARTHGAYAAAAPTTVVVCADQRLVAETICAALGSRGFATELLEWRWSSETVSPVPRPRRRGERRDSDAARRVLLLVGDLDQPGRLGEARDLGRRSGLPWLVIDALEPGPAWGALLEAGARGVLASRIAVDDLVEALGTVASGGSTFDDLERQMLIRQWHVFKEIPEHMFQQLQVVAEHDREILVMLYEGSTVRAIAERFGLSEAAVARQMRSVLRQLALVVHQVEGDPADQHG